MTYGGIDRFWWRDCHLVQHPRHPFSKLRTEQPGAELHKGPPDDPPDSPKQPSGEEVPREGPRHGTHPHVPAAPQQSQQHEHGDPTGQPNDNLGMTEYSHLGLQQMIGCLALRDGSLTGPELVQALVNRRGGPSRCGGDVSHHGSQLIWKINKTINKIRIRIQFYGTKYIIK
jgi:hypothetical protein